MLKLYSPENIIDLDPTYSTGKMYSGRVAAPRLKYDLHPQMENVKQSSAEDLRLPDNSINTIMFDPPFLLRTSGPNSYEYKITQRFGCFETLEDLQNMYISSLQNFKKMLTKKGIIIFKCQDFKFGAMQYYTHAWLIAAAHNIGLYCEDLCIYVSTSMIIQNKKQRSARKNHSYFLVLSKKNYKKYFNF